jgi:hypothetical protein
MSAAVVAVDTKPALLLTALVDLVDLDFRAFLAIENLHQSECLKIDPVDARQADKNDHT